MAIHSKPVNIHSVFYTTEEYAESKDSKNNSLRNQSDEYVFAKCVLDSLGKSLVNSKIGYNYYIRLDGNKIIDPRKIFSLPENKTSYIDRVCKGDDIWVKVPQSAFEKYLQFLQTQNDQWYKETMRDSK